MKPALFSILVLFSFVIADEGKPAKPAEPESVSVCPQFVWMHWGSYCSYYSLQEGTCFPMNYDSTDCSLASGDCETGDNCLTTLMLDGKAVMMDGPGQKGYTGDKLSHWGNGGIPGSDKTHNVKKLDNFVIRFEDDDGDPLYAQIFVGRINVKKNATQRAIFCRGQEITSHQNHINLSGTKLVEPVKGVPHAYVYHYGNLDVRIVTHEDTVGHGK